MRKILVAVDGSAQANNALQVASTLAVRGEDQIIILNVVNQNQITGAMRSGIEVEFSNEIRDKMDSKQFSNTPLPDEQQYARTIPPKNRKEQGVVEDILGENIIKHAATFIHDSEIDDFETILLRGDPAKQILTYINSHEIDAIVIGSHGAGKIAGLVLGSVSQAVLQAAKCMVIIVKPPTVSETGTTNL